MTKSHSFYMKTTRTWVGYQWLAEHYSIKPVQAFRIDSRITRSRSTERNNGFTHECYPLSFRPDDSFAGHITFALKNEGIHLEFLARLFAVVDKQEIEAYINNSPSGQYARRTGFLYEWLTGIQLEFGGVAIGNYVDAIDDKLYFTAVHPVNNQRWRVRDNLPGTPEYCPMIFRTDKVREAERYDCQKYLHDLEVEYGQDLLMRSAVWLTVKESQASFTIEREDKQLDRIQRFANVMENRCGYYDQPLSTDSIIELQNQILGPRATHYGLRKSPVFVGETNLSSMNVVHYIAPDWHDAVLMLQGLSSFAEKTAGKSSIIRAAVMSFGFVYIHPMVDGNGRVSRFLINDTLRRDNALPAPFILPVSATIISSTHNRRGYDQILEVFSKPLMQRYHDQYRFGADSTGEDGVKYNFYFNAYPDACAAWRYPDLTEHTEYLAHIIDQTINFEMRNEARILRSIQSARARIKEIMDGPDQSIDRIIRSVRDNHNAISNKLCKSYTMLDDPEVAEAIIQIIREEFPSAHD